MAETGEEDAREKFVLWSKTDKHTRQGAVLDIDTGMLRRDHVLVLRSPQAEITLGLGGTSAALMDFAKSGDTRDDPFLKACGEADQAIARGDFEGTRDLGVPDVIPLQKVISDTSKEAEMMRTRREDQGACHAE